VMGGLLDIYFASAEERRRITDLIDQLWAAQSRSPNARICRRQRARCCPA
jgi:hypothetical protein